MEEPQLRMASCRTIFLKREQRDLAYGKLKSSPTRCVAERVLGGSFPCGFIVAGCPTPSLPYRTSTWVVLLMFPIGTSWLSGRKVSSLLEPKLESLRAGTLLAKVEILVRCDCFLLSSRPQPS